MRARLSFITTLLLLGIAVFPAFSFSPALDCDTSKHRSLAVLLVPAFGYSPETSTYLGIVGLMNIRLFDDSIARASNAKAEFNYTLKKQYITDLGWEVYTRQEKYYLKGRLTFSRYPDLYYGIGENTPSSNKISYDSRRKIVDISILRSVSRYKFIGIIIKYNNYEIINNNSGSLDAYPELVSASDIGAGIRYMTDKRNNLLNPTEGRYIDICYTYNKSKNKEYGKFSLDGRYYRTFRERHTIALRCLGLFTLQEAPFYDLALLGGDNQVRGYLTGRYRERNLVSLQSEYRTFVYHRWGVAVFGGLTKVNHEVGKINMNGMKFNYGGGLRFLIDRKNKTSLRLDYALGNDHSSGFYIAFGESF